MIDKKGVEIRFISVRIKVQGEDAGSCPFPYALLKKMIFPDLCHNYIQTLSNTLETILTFLKP